MGAPAGRPPVARAAGRRGDQASRGRRGALLPAGATLAVGQARPASAGPAHTALGAARPGRCTCSCRSARRAPPVRVATAGARAAADASPARRKAPATLVADGLEGPAAVAPGVGRAGRKWLVPPVAVAPTLRRLLVAAPPPLAATALAVAGARADPGLGDGRPPVAQGSGSVSRTGYRSTTGTGQC